MLLSYSESHFRPQHLVIGPAISSTHGSGTVDVHLIPTSRDDEVDHIPVSGTRMHPSGLVFILLLEHGVRHYQFELRAQSQLAIGVAFPNPMFAHDQGPLVIFSSYPRIEVSY